MKRNIPGFPSSHSFLILCQLLHLHSKGGQKNCSFKVTNVCYMPLTFDVSEYLHFQHGPPCSQSKEASETTEAVLVTNNGANSIPLPSVSVQFIHVQPLFPQWFCDLSPSLEILTQVSTRGSVVKIDEAKMETTVVLESEQESECGSHHQL